MAADGDIEFTLRRMRAADLAEVMAIERECFPNPWPENTFRGEIQNEGLSHPLVAVAPATGTIIGYVIYWLVQDEVQINNVAARDLYERKLGFVFLDIRAAYYTNPTEDALVLGLPL